MRTQEFVIKTQGDSPDALLEALEEAIKAIKAGHLGGGNKGDNGSYSFEVLNGFAEIKIADITDEADHIADQLSDITEAELHDFAGCAAYGLDLADLADFGGYIEGNIPSIIQVLIGECGGVDNDGDATVAEKLSEFLDLDSPLTTLADASQPRP